MRCATTTQRSLLLQLLSCLPPLRSTLPAPGLHNVAVATTPLVASPAATVATKSRKVFTAGGRQVLLRPPTTRAAHNRLPRGFAILCAPPRDSSGRLHGVLAPGSPGLTQLTQYLSTQQAFNTVAAPSQYSSTPARAIQLGPVGTRRGPQQHVRDWFPNGGWVLDSGATLHMASDDGILPDFTPFPLPSCVTVGNSSSMPIS